MSLVLLHGPAQSSKRLEAAKIKKQFEEENISVFDFKKTEVSFEEILATKSLFQTGKRLMVVENPPVDFDLKDSSSDDTTILIVAGVLKEQSSLLLAVKKLSGKIIFFAGDKEVSAFPYLDNLIEGKKGALLELDKLLDEYGQMYVFSMIYYLLRRNILPLPASSFMKSKINTQKSKYSLEDFKKFYQQVLETEFSIKNGSTDGKIALTFLTQKIISSKN